MNYEFNFEQKCLPLPSEHFLSSGVGIYQQVNCGYSSASSSSLKSLARDLMA